MNPLMSKGACKGRWVSTSKTVSRVSHLRCDVVVQEGAGGSNDVQQGVVVAEGGVG